jgi:hypothetical protein
MANAWVVTNGGAFPLWYHWRIIPGVVPLGPSEAEIGRAVNFWAGSAEVETRLRALSTSSTVVAMFLGYVPLTRFVTTFTGNFTTATFRRNIRLRSFVPLSTGSMARRMWRGPALTTRTSSRIKGDMDLLDLVAIKPETGTRGCDKHWPFGDP